MRSTTTGPKTPPLVCARPTGLKPVVQCRASVLACSRRPGSSSPCVLQGRRARNVRTGGACPSPGSGCAPSRAGVPGSGTCRESGDGGAGVRGTPLEDERRAEVVLLAGGPKPARPSRPRYASVIPWPSWHTTGRSRQQLSNGRPAPGFLGLAAALLELAAPLLHPRPTPPWSW